MLLSNIFAVKLIIARSCAMHGKFVWSNNGKGYFMFAAHQIVHNLPYIQMNTIWCVCITFTKHPISFVKSWINMRSIHCKSDISQTIVPHPFIHLSLSLSLILASMFENVRTIKNSMNFALRRNMIHINSENRRNENGVHCVRWMERASDWLIKHLTWLFIYKQQMHCSCFVWSTFVSTFNWNAREPQTAFTLSERMATWSEC